MASQGEPESGRVYTWLRSSKFAGPEWGHEEGNPSETQIYRLDWRGEAEGRCVLRQMDPVHIETRLVQQSAGGPW